MSAPLSEPSSAAGSPVTSLSATAAVSLSSPATAPASSSGSAAVWALALTGPVVESVAADQVLAGELAGPAGAVGFGTYGAVGRAACQSASELLSSLRATMAAIPPMATTMASRFSHFPFFFGAADSS